ncbi:hypothetical protein Bccel_5444 [Pseudobacteroides cellulosolvens ATCC 35603 = DSM 2933]|uniref:Uncharacterized protein n=1 Tax=Pseudobacteroides cellulosolvens ATCC 35603 = DSM 2933 TaxID=398512 RepID=A0A0L6JXJ6_9FIRM|nr:hypothetical protein Bccel_5444 [Pseudobacteroides cellulosolvens ATCC 35603 = DSM 2933]
MSMTVGKLKQILSQITDDDIEVKVLVQNDMTVGVKIAEKGINHFLIETDNNNELNTIETKSNNQLVQELIKVEKKDRTGEKINLTVTAVNHVGDCNKKIVYTFKGFDSKLYKWHTSKLLVLRNERKYNLRGTIESVEGNTIKLKRCTFSLISEQE